MRYQGKGRLDDRKYDGNMQSKDTWKGMPTGLRASEVMDGATRRMKSISHSGDPIGSRPRPT